MKKASVNNHKKILFSLLLIFIVLIFILYDFLAVREVRMIDMKMKVDDHIGFDLNSDYLEFGTATPGSEPLRTMKIYNNYDYPLIVDIDVIPKNGIDLILGKTKTIPEEWVKISQNNFILESNQSKTIEFTIKTDENAAYGNYTAVAAIKFSYVNIK